MNSVVPKIQTDVLLARNTIDAGSIANETVDHNSVSFLDSYNPSSNLINNACGFVLECSEKAVFVVDVDQIEKTEKLLEKNGFKTLDTEALSAIEPFHYMKY